VIGPKGMPADVVQKLNEAISTIVKSENFKGQIAAEGATPSPMKPDVLLEFMKSEFKKHGALVAQSGAVIQ
jgi:tripartite-type tricarboxylate transporter receptor subunit TctC